MAQPSAAAEMAACTSIVNLGGKEWKAAPLTLEDCGDWNMMAQAEHLRAARRSLTDEEDPIRMISLWREAQTFSTGLCIFSIRANNILNSMTGRVWLVWLSLRRGGATIHVPNGPPDMTRPLTTEDVYGWAVKEPAAFIEAVDTVLSLSGWMQKGEYKADPRAAILTLIERMS